MMKRSALRFLTIDFGKNILKEINTSKELFKEAQSLMPGGVNSPVRAFKNIGGTINALDIYTTLENGYCYSRFYLSESENISFVSEPILQVGKFDGEFPFSIDITGEYKGKVFSKKIKINEENILQGDSITEKIWAGQYLRNLEKASQSNSVINNIVSASKEFTVLSKYTSFLCLEEKEDYACFDCFDESILKVNSLNLQDEIFSFYPNKHITTGEGGMCVTNDADLNDQMCVLRDHGMSKEKRYWHDRVGYNYRMTNLQAAIGVGQLERIDEILQFRREIEQAYKEICTDINFIQFEKDFENKNLGIALIAKPMQSIEKAIDSAQHIVYVSMIILVFSLNTPNTVVV